MMQPPPRLPKSTLLTRHLTTRLTSTAMRRRSTGERLPSLMHLRGKWVLAASYTGFHADEHEPAVENVPGAVVAVGLDGSVHVASAKSATVTSIVPRGRRIKSRHTPEGVTEKSTLQVAAVGSRAAVFDTQSSTLYYGDQQSLNPEDPPLHLDKDITLQESGPESDTVLLASARELLSVPLSGGAVRVTENGKKSGLPSRPVMHRAAPTRLGAVAGLSCARL